MSICSGSDHVHPGETKQCYAKKSARGNQQSKSEEYCRQEHVVEIEKGKIVAYTFHKQSGGSFNEKRSFFTKAKNN